jgi:hypothetical protein
MNTGTEDSSVTRRSAPGRILAHLLGFGLLLALILVLLRGTPQSGDAIDRVAFTEVDLKQIYARHTRTWNRPPTEEELRKAMEQYVRNEIFYREALARNFDQNDPTVRLAMVRKLIMLGTARAEAAVPGDKELQAYFSLRRERYRMPAQVDLVQVFVSTDKRGDTAREDAKQLLAALHESDPGADELHAFGDAIMLDSVQADMSESDLDRTFGTGFSEAVLGLEPGRWTGPVESGYGLHLVKVLRRDDAAIPDWRDVCSRLITDMQYEARAAAEDQLYAEIAPRYQIVYDDAVTSLMEGAAR